jgi:uncharacterized damage-inducible protein DinB
MRSIAKPKEGEYAPYAIQYIKLLPDDGRVLEHLLRNFEAMKALVRSLPEQKLLYRYAEGKWSIKEVLVHIVDDERIYAYRALRFARNDATELPGFEQDDYTRESGADARPLANIMEEYETVRRSTVAMFDGFTDEAFLRSGIANGHRVSVRALAYHLAGHELHHMNILREKYLK